MNEFEFRASSSSPSCSAPNVVLNTVIAEAFHFALQKILQDIVRTHKRID